MALPCVVFCLLTHPSCYFLIQHLQQCFIHTTNHFSDPLISFEDVVNHYQVILLLLQAFTATLIVWLLQAAVNVLQFIAT